MIAPQEPQLPGNPASAETSRSTAQTTATAATETRAGSAKRVGITANIRHRAPRFHSHSAASVAYRCHQLFGESPQTWEQRLSQDYKRVAQMNGVMRMMGALDLLTGKMMPVELSLAGAPQPDALHRESMTDFEEDVLQEAFRVNRSEQTARALLRKRAASRAASLDHDREIAAEFGITL